MELLTEDSFIDLVAKISDIAEAVKICDFDLQAKKLGSALESVS
jgi:hypothetical protein